MRLGAIASLLVLADCSTAAPRSGPAPAGFADRQVVVEHVAYRYRIFVPRAFRADTVWPVVLFLHGIGERGSDNERPARYSLGAYLSAHGDSFPAIVVFPQVPADSYWTGQPARAAIAALDATIHELHGDRNRLYLTGLSMGGYGSWEMALAYPGRFAAAVIVCGGIVAPSWDARIVVHDPAVRSSDPYRAVARKLGRLPVWLFHGDADRTIPVSESRRMRAALEALGAPVRYTEYAGVDHNVWDRAYADREMWSWLLSQRRNRT